MIKNNTTSFSFTNFELDKKLSAAIAYTLILKLRAAVTVETVIAAAAL